jgi:AI-2 transport protein TqsA
MSEPATVEREGMARFRRELVPLYALAAAVVSASGGWYLLKELAPLLRPLVLAVFLAYTILPALDALGRRVPARLAGPLLAVLVGLALLAMAVLEYRNLVELSAAVPRLTARAYDLAGRAGDWARSRLPAWVFEPAEHRDGAEADTSARLKALAARLVNAAAGFLGEALVVGLYLIFLLAEVHRFPARVRAGFDPGQAEKVLGVVGSINRAMASYLRAKVLASLCTALPVFAILWAFGVPFPGMWGVLAFVGNFIPYVGGLVAFVPPVALAFLELSPVWRPVSVLVLLSISAVVTNNIVDPRLTAHAVDLSPLVVLVALTFWGLCWGVVGMVLAVPLTVMLKVVWENIALTRPLARLMSGD